MLALEEEIFPFFDHIPCCNQGMYGGVCVCPTSVTQHMVLVDYFKLDICSFNTPSSNLSFNSCSAVGFNSESL